MTRNLDRVTAHYIECALWADAPDEEIDYISPSEEFLAKAREDCKSFIKLVKETGADSDLWSDTEFGHDFWLTRQGHGAGFWDRGYGGLHEEVSPGARLTKLAKTFSHVDLYVGDDGYLYMQ